MSQAKVGVGVIIKNNGKVLLGKRVRAQAWCFPGGHVDFFEPVMDAAKRETLEETGLVLNNLILATYTDDFFKHTNEHFVTVVFIANSFSGKVRLTEPDNFERWEWFAWNNLPSPLAEPMRQLILQNFNPFRTM